MTQPQLTKEFANAKIPDNWRPILIKGPGVRQKAVRKSKHISPSTSTPQPSRDETSSEPENPKESTLPVTQCDQLGDQGSITDCKDERPKETT